MLEGKIKNAQEIKIGELERELACYQGFTISHMLNNNLMRLVTFAPDIKYLDVHKVVLVLKSGRDR